MEPGTPLPRFTGHPSKAERRPILRFLCAKAAFEGLRGPSALGVGHWSGHAPSDPARRGKCKALEFTARLQAQSCREALHCLLGSGSCRKITPAD